MSSLTLKMLLFSKSSLPAILSIALLVAIVSSTSAVTNHINAQTEAFTNLTDGGVFLILSRNSTSIGDSVVEANLANLVRGVAGVEYVLPQRVITANLVAKSSYTVTIRAVDNVSSYLKLRGAHVNGLAAGNSSQVNIGVVLARLASINVGDVVDLVVNNKSISVEVTGIVKTLTQSDVEVVASIEIVQQLTGDGRLSLIEFTVRRGVSSRDVVNNITSFSPSSIRIVKTFQLEEFIHDVNRQTLSFLNLWFLAIYIVVVAASYIIALRLTLDLNYEFTMLRALGARGSYVFTLVLTYIIVIALVASIVGLSLGLVAAQTVSTLTRWLGLGVEVYPFLNLEQIPQITLYTVTSSILGSALPTLRCVRGRFYEAFRL